MFKSRKFIAGISIGALAGAALLWRGLENRALPFIDASSSISFAYPKAWGAPAEIKGNSACPEEDTYRTPETLSIFDRELKFEDIDLKGTESFFRIGLRFYKMDPEASNKCNDDVLRVLAKQEMAGEEFSSFRLLTANIPGFYGVVNENASRLDTEYRTQYTLFRKEAGGKILVIQPYASFVPHFDSPEWKELEAKWKGDAASLIKEGESAEEERKILEKFRLMAESLR